MNQCKIYLLASVGCWKNVYGPCWVIKKEKTVGIRTGLATAKSIKAVKFTVFRTVYLFLSDSQKRLMGSGIQMDFIQNRVYLIGLMEPLEIQDRQGYLRCLNTTLWTSYFHLLDPLLENIVVLIRLLIGQKFPRRTLTWWTCCTENTWARSGPRKTWIYFKTNLDTSKLMYCK